MTFTVFVFLVVSTCALSTGESIEPVHGVSYRIKSIPHEAYLSASSHFAKPGSGIIYGKVAGDLWQGSPNQIWDAVAVEGNGNVFWFVPKAAVGNEISYIAEDTYNRAEYLNNNNVIEVVPLGLTKAKKQMIALKSIHYGKCLQSHDFLPATYEICQPKKRSQQWELDPVREIPNPEATHFQHRDRFGNFYLQKKNQYSKKL